MSKLSDTDLLLDFLTLTICWMTADPIGQSDALLTGGPGTHGFESFKALDDATKYTLFMHACRGSVRGASLKLALEQCTTRTRREVERYIKTVSVDNHVEEARSQL